MNFNLKPKLCLKDYSQGKLMKPSLTGLYVHAYLYYMLYQWQLWKYWKNSFLNIIPNLSLEEPMQHKISQ